MEWAKDAIGWIVGGLGSLFAGLLAVILYYERKDRVRYDKGMEELATLKGVMVTRSELSTAMDRFEESLREMHRENLSNFQNLYDKVDEDKQRQSDTRHAIRDELHAIAVKVAALEAQQR